MKHMVAVYFDLKKRLTERGDRTSEKIQSLSAHSYLQLSVCQMFSCSVGEFLSAWYKLENGVPRRSPLSVTLSVIALSGIFARRQISWKMPKRRLPLFCSAKTTAMINHRVQRLIDTVAESARIIGFSFLSTKTALCISVDYGKDTRT